MSSDQIITTGAEIVEAIDARTYRAALPNGKIVHAHLPRSADGAPPLEPGDSVRLELNPYDFSRARIRPDSD